MVAHALEAGRAEDAAALARQASELRDALALADRETDTGATIAAQLAEVVMVCGSVAQNIEGARLFPL